MECLHGLPASAVSTKNGKFWLCDKNNPKSCELFCPDQDRSLFETAMSMWRANGPIHPVCDTHQRLARMKVVKDVSKLNFGRPFFVCCDRENPCKFWQWGDRHELPKPKCGHGLNACVRKVKKDGENQGRLFFCCPNDREKSCGFFEWKLDLEHPFNQVHFPHVERVGILQSNPALYTYMVAETGLIFTSARENPHDAYAEYMGELPISSHANAMGELSLIDY